MIVRVLAPNRKAICALCGLTISPYMVRTMIGIGTVTRRMHYCCLTDEIRKAGKEFRKEQKEENHG